jgi:hypothetical protein
MAQCAVFAFQGQQIGSVFVSWTRLWQSGPQASIILIHVGHICNRKKSFLPPWSVGSVQVSSLESKTGYLASSNSQNQARDLPDPNPPRFYITWRHVTMSTCPRPAYVSPVPPVRRRGQINHAASTSLIPHFSQTLAETGGGRRASYRRRPAGVVQAAAVDART